MGNDPKLRIPETQQYDANYFSRKHRIPIADARVILIKAGRSRDNANAMVRAVKKSVR